MNKAAREPSVRRFKPYPAYKDSGVEWLGEIPAHWDVRRLKFVLAARLKYGANEAAELDDPDLPRYVRITDIDESDGLRDETFKSLPAEVATEYLLREGDLLFARSGATAGKTFLYRRSWGVCAYAGYLIRARLDTKIACPEFVRYFTASSGYWQWLSSVFIQATIQNVSADRYASLFVPLHSLDEQRAIAAFLDRETAKIGALVTKKERLLELLQEERVALITRAVTKGLDPNVPMKDSGVEWLGDIPAHWNVGGLARWWQVIDCKHRTVPFLDEGIALASIGEVQSLEVDLSAAKRTSVEEYAQMISGGRDPRRGDIIYSRNATVGAAALVTVEEPFCMGQDVVLIRAADQDQRFLVFLLRSPAIMGQLDSLMVGSTFNRINVSEIKKLWVCDPPLDEQRRIAAFCQKEHRKTEQLVLKVQSAVDRLRELRTALISAAVTGKIDVRSASAGTTPYVGA